MFIDTVTLIDQTIDNLTLLSEMFADELDERLHDPGQLSADSRKFRDALSASRGAIAKLQAARSTQVPGAMPERVCANCDDF
jgi:hypothetical protein